MKTKFIYIRNTSLHPIGCIAYRLDNSNRQIKIGVSMHHPNDKWNRKIARELAVGRMTLSHELFVDAYETQQICASRKHELQYVLDLVERLQTELKLNRRQLRGLTFTKLYVQRASTLKTDLMPASNGQNYLSLNENSREKVLDFPCSP